jgi:hypothetical protein
MFPLEQTPIHVPDDVLDDLRRRLIATKWPLDVGNEDGYYGVRRPYLQGLVGILRTLLAGPSTVRRERRRGGCCG